MSNSLSEQRVSRRDLLRWLGAGAVASAWRDIPLGAAARPGTGQPASVQAGAVIRTVLGDISPDALADGTTLFHEHLSIALPPAFFAPNPPPERWATDDVDFVVQEIRTAADEGVVCIVDGGHPDMGRDMTTLLRVARETPVHVVASGGYYLEVTYPPEIASKSEDEIADDLVREAERDRLGAFGEIGQTSNAAEMTPTERKVFRAVGGAHVRTGLPIFTHNAYGTGSNVRPDAGLRQLDVLESVGVSPEHVTIGHACCLDDPTAAVLTQIAARGAFVGFDRVTGGRVPDDQKVTTLVAFLEAGHADKLLVSADFTGNRSPARPGYGNPVTVFAPLMRQAGVDEDVVRATLNDNPRRFLAFVPTSG